MLLKFANLVLHTKPSEKYGGHGTFTLADGIRGSDDFHDKKWLGFNGNNCEIEINLGQKKDISKIKIGYLSNPGSWIFPPKYVTVLSTQNGEHILTECEWGATSILANESMAHIGEIEIDCNIKNTRLLKITIENIGICPDWHDGKGEKAWLFVDEVWAE